MEQHLATARGEVMEKTPQGPIPIGWKEYVDFPDWGIGRVKAKMDTGARTSVLDAVSYDIQQTERGPVVEVRLAPYRRHPERLLVVQAPVLRTIVIRNSSGSPEERPLIETTLRLGPVIKRIRLTVTNRAGMCFRMLLGRKALEGDFVVDVSRKYLLRQK